MKVNVIQKADTEEVPVEILAQSIEAIAAGMKKINASRLKRDAVVILLQAQTGVNRNDIRAVMDGLDSLERKWLKPKTAK